MSKRITKNLRFEIDYDTYRDFWDLGNKVFNLRTKSEILERMIDELKEKYKNEIK